MATIEQLETAIRRADAAGDADAVRKLGAEYRRLQQEMKLRPENFGGLPAFELPNQIPTGEGDETRSTMSERLQIAAGLMTTHDPQRQMRIIADALPEGVVFDKDENGNFIVDARQIGGTRGMLNPEGLDERDAIRLAGTVLSFLPAGRAAGVGTTLGSQALRVGAASGATQAGLDIVNQALGGTDDVSVANVDPTDVALAGVGGGAGQAAGAWLSRAAPEAAKFVFRGGEQGRQNLTKAIDDFAEFGGTPSVGQGTGDAFRQGVETLSSRVLGGRPIINAIETTTRKMQSRLGQIADDLSPVRGDVEAGRVIQRGITGAGGFLDRNAGTARSLWGALDDKIGDQAKTAASQTRSMLDELVRNDSFAKVMNNPRLVQIKQAMDEAIGQGGAIPYRDLKALRSQVGEMLSGNELLSGVPRSQLKRLYGALSDDIRTVAESSGAMREFNRANAFTRATHKRVDDFVERVANKVDLDKVFQAVARGGEGVQSINAIKRSLRPEEWEAVASNVIRRMGRATSGQQDDLGQAFSVNRFLTDWDRLGPAKNAIFSGSRKLNQYRANMDKIASAASRFREDATAMANPSGTGQMLANVGLLSGMGVAAGTGNVGNLGILLGGVAANNLSARLMTNPHFVNWLAQSATTKSLPAHIGRLAGVATASDAQEDVHDFLRTLQSMTVSPSLESSRPE